MKYSWALLLIISAYPCLAEVDAQAIVMNCMNCHQAGSASDEASIPKLEGISKQQLLQSLLNFKYDKQPATLMPRIAKGYSDNELAAVADYLSRP